MSGAIARALRRLRSLFRDDALDHELDAEIDAHIGLAIAENLRRGMSPDEARRQAMLRFGNVASAKEEQRDARLLPALDAVRQDVRFALRAFRRERGFAAVVVLILAVGIGANVAVFSVVDALMLKPLPFAEPQRLAWLSVKTGGNSLSGSTFTVSAYEEYRRANQSFESVTCYNPFLGSSETKLVGHGEPQPVTMLMIADDYFRTLGVAPALGREFTPGEVNSGSAPVAVLSDAFWRRQFAGDPSVVGKTMTLDKTTVTIVGVMPAGFDFGSVFSPGVRVDFYVPAPLDQLRNWGNTLALVGRLEPGVTIAQAQAESDVLFPRLKAEHADWFMDYSATVTGLREHVSGTLRRPLTILWGAVGLTLLIVCVNLSSLMLARTAARGKEFALRAALGALRSRIVGQMVIESLVLTLTGGALGLLLGFGLTYYISHQGSIALPLLASVRVDGKALAWTGLIVAASAALLGFAPALRISFDRIQEALKDSGRGMTAGTKQAKLRSVLVIVETALACMLLVGAGLLLRSFVRILDVDLGFEPSNAVVMKVDYDDGGDDTRRGVVLEEMLDDVRALPGIQAAGVTDMLPLDRNRSWGFEAKGRDYPKEFDRSAFIRIVTPGYIDAIGARLLEGRDFDWHDSADSEHVVIINETAAKRHFPGEDAVGKLANGIGRGDARVIGVIADVRQTSVEDRPNTEVYAPVTQNDPEGAELVVRSSLPPDVIAATVAKTMRSRGPNQLAAEIRPVQTLVDHAVSPRRFFVLLVGAFATLGLVLAALGIYGVISYSVTSQTQEIGIRMALGATAGRIQRGVIARTLRLAIAGAALGALGSIGAAASISSMLFGTVPTDPATFGGTVALLVGVALVAGYLPARRASRVDPTTALGGG